jgi:hypothetical protein
MRTSSANQLAFDYEVAGPAEGAPAQVGISTSAASSGGHSKTAASPLLSDLRSYDPIYAVTARLAGRINAASIPKEEHQTLLRERQLLLDKDLGGTISRQEAHRLEYVRWSLDRIEDAKYGQNLEVLEDSVRQYERLLAELNSLSAHIQTLLPRNKS